MVAFGVARRKKITKSIVFKNRNLRVYRDFRNGSLNQTAKWIEFIYFARNVCEKPWNPKKVTSKKKNNFLCGPPLSSFLLQSPCTHSGRNTHIRSIHGVKASVKIVTFSGHKIFCAIFNEIHYEQPFISRHQLNPKIPILSTALIWMTKLSSIANYASEITHPPEIWLLWFQCRLLKVLL